MHRTSKKFGLVGKKKRTHANKCHSQARFRSGRNIAVHKAAKNAA